MENKTIDIIVPLYNSYHLLDRFIESIRLEKNITCELWFVDNTEEDNPDYISITDLIERYQNKVRQNLHDIHFCRWAFRLMYSGSVSYYYNTHIKDQFNHDKRFLVFNPDCFPIEQNWLSRMLEIWNKIEQDNKIASLGSLQYFDERKDSIWHFGCWWKGPNDPGKRDDLDWNHNSVYNKQEYLKVDGNTGTGIMMSKEAFDKYNFNVQKFPHYCSDADWCLETSKLGYSHFCSNVAMIHSPNNSTKK